MGTSRSIGRNGRGRRARCRRTGPPELDLAASSTKVHAKLRLPSHRMHPDLEPVIVGLPSSLETEQSKIAFRDSRHDPTSARGNQTHVPGLRCASSRAFATLGRSGGIRVSTPWNGGAVERAHIVVLLAGLPQTWWLAQGDARLAERFHVIAIDLPGQGPLRIVPKEG